MCVCGYDCMCVVLSVLYIMCSVCCVRFALLYGLFIICVVYVMCCIYVEYVMCFVFVECCVCCVLYIRVCGYVHVNVCVST